MTGELDFDEDDLFRAVEESFDGLLQEGGGDAARDPALESGADVDELRDLFLQIAAEHARPIREHMDALRASDGRRDAQDVDMTLFDARASLKVLTRTARGMEMGFLSTALADFQEAFEDFHRAAGEGTALAHRARHRHLWATFDGLVGQVPEVFSASGPRDRSEPLVVRSLLSQVPTVQVVAIDKLFAAGLGRIDTLADADPEDLSAVTHLPQPDCFAIVERFRDYRLEAARLGDDPKAHLASLTTWVDELKVVQAAYEEAEGSWTELARKDRRVLRRVRADAVAEIHIVLARMSEFSLVEELVRAPFARKVALLNQYLMSRGVSAQR